MRVVLTAKAKRDLFRIYSYIDERNPSAAESIVQRIRNNFDNLARFPFIGRERSSRPPGFAASLSGYI
jgi:plasmid stabilization system protein ParE